RFQRAGTDFPSKVAFSVSKAGEGVTGWCGTTHSIHANGWCVRLNGYSSARIIRGCTILTISVYLTWLPTVNSGGTVRKNTQRLWDACASGCMNGEIFSWVRVRVRIRWMK